MSIRSSSGWHAIAFVLVSLLGSMPGCKGRDVEYGHEVDGDKQSTGPLRNGQKHGPWTTVQNGKVIRFEYWRDGVLHGPSRLWDDFGYMDRMWIDGKLHGRFRSFYENGQLAELEWFFKYKRHGMSCGWYPDGTLEWIRIHQHDAPMERVRDPPGECPLVLDEPRHLDPDDQNYR